MKLYNHLQLNVARAVISLANQGLSRYKINKIIEISKGKIRRCLNSCEIKTSKPHLSQPWKGPWIKTQYSFRLYQAQRDEAKQHRAYVYATHAATIYQDFSNFCQHLYETKILGQKVARSADEFIKEFKKTNPEQPYPRRNWVYKMARSPHYDFNPQWLPSKKNTNDTLKSDDESKKLEKYNSIATRPSKVLLRSFSGNYEIDSVIGKRDGKQALCTLIDIHNGFFYSAFYNRKMEGFRDVLKAMIKANNIKINTLTMDNGGENNLLHTIIDRSKLFNCHPYASGEKGTLENTHRLIRRIIPKGKSLDSYTSKDLVILNQFINNYYSRTFNRL